MRIRTVSFWAVVIDQGSKYLVSHYFHPGQSITLIPNLLALTYINNPGAAFGFMANVSPFIRIPFFILITIGAGLVVYAYQRHLPADKIWQRFCLGLIWGGAVGNFIDRVFYRQVVDFIDVERIAFGRYHFPYIFNVADSCITVGIILLFLIHYFDVSDKPENR